MDTQMYNEYVGKVAIINPAARTPIMIMDDTNPSSIEYAKKELEDLKKTLNDPTLILIVNGYTYA